MSACLFSPKPRPPPYDSETLAAIYVGIGLSQKLNGLYVADESTGKENSSDKEMPKKLITRPRPLLGGLVARIASVILERPISRDQLRDWQEGYWGGGFVTGKREP
jgi:hypothetical protein